MDDLAFSSRFRLTKDIIIIIYRNHSVAPIDQLLMTLRFYASGSFLISIGDFMNVSKSTCCRIINKVTRAIASLSPDFIKMPSTEEAISATHVHFYNIARLPRIVGSLDCTHIRISSPGTDNAEVFRNRKGYFSINVQTVSSADLQIMDLVARWPGSTHDQIIFDNSRIFQRLHANAFGNSMLVADSGYADTSHVVTPIATATTEVEQLYNESVRRTRNPVERSYGTWKRRFPVLALGLRLKLDTSLAVIVACGVLNNIAIQHKENLPPDDEYVLNDVDMDEDFELDPLPQHYAYTAKDELLANYFPQLLEGLNHNS
nr:unnamed protein product [Callosobruchus analis]